MNMDSEQMLLMGAVCMAVYLAGYQSLAIGIFILLVLSSLVAGRKAPTAKGMSMGGVTVKGAETLEPIIIETTRGAPFRIPSKMHVRIKPKWGGRPWVEKAMGRGIGRMARWGYRPLGPSNY